MIFNIFLGQMPNLGPLIPQFLLVVEPRDLSQLRLLRKSCGISVFRSDAAKCRGRNWWNLEVAGRSNEICGNFGFNLYRFTWCFCKVLRESDACLGLVVKTLGTGIRIIPILLFVQQWGTSKVHMQWCVISEAWHAIWSRTRRHMRPEHIANYVDKADVYAYAEAELEDPHESPTRIWYPIDMVSESGIPSMVQYG